jgi:hypothetical protein
MEKKRDVLLGMAKAGNSLGEAPLFINKGAKNMSMFTHITSTTSSSCEEDLLPDIAEMKKWQREYLKTIQG